MDASEYIDKAKEKLGLTSDYAFAKKLELSRGALSEMRSGKRDLTDEYLIFRLAEILEIDASQIIVDLKSQSEKNPKKKAFWLAQVATGGIRKIRSKLIELRIMYIMLNRVFVIILVALFSTATASSYSNSPKQLVAWTGKAWDDYLYWQEKDRKKVKRINALIKELQRSNFSEIGKPEALKHKLSGFWSLRVNGKHRIIYKITQELILIWSCRGHY